MTDAADDGSPALKAEAKRAQLLLRRFPGAEEHQPAGPRQEGHRAHRPVRLRQVDAAALLQPDARPVSGQPLRGRDPPLPGRHQHRSARRSTRSRCACGSAWCSRSRTRSPSRSSRTSLTACACAASANRRLLEEKVEEALRDAALWDEVKDRLDDLGVQPLRRPAAAAVHRPRAGDRSGDPAVRRADLSPRPDRDRQHRGADRRPQGAGDDPDRHAQHAAGRPRLRLHRLHVPGRADRVRRHRHDLHKPEKKLTEDYITGRFG